MRDLTRGNIYKTFLVFSLPAICSGLLSQAYHIIDTIIAGRFLGQEGIAAVGATSSLVTLISCAFGGYAVGFSLYIAKLFGAKEYRKIKECIYNNCIFVGLALLLISVILVLCSDKIMSLLCVDKSIVDSTIGYFAIYMLGFVLISFSMLGNYTMQAFGNSAFPLGMSIVSSVLNIGGNLLCVAVLDVGVKGLALSSVTAALVVDVLYLMKLRSYFKRFGIQSHFKFDVKSIKTSFTYSIPVLIQQMIMYTSDMLISPMINGMGVSVTSAYSVACKIKALSDQTYYNSSKALSNYAAQCIGAGKAKNLNNGVKAGFVLGMLFLIPVVLICLCGANAICSMFFPNGYTGEAVDYAVLFVRSYMPFVAFNVVNNLFHAFFRGIKAMDYLIAVTFIGSFARYISTLFLTPVYGINGIYAGMVVAWIIEMVICVILYLSGKWKVKCSERIREEVYGRNISDNH